VAQGWHRSRLQQSDTVASSLSAVPAGTLPNLLGDLWLFAIFSGLSGSPFLAGHALDLLTTAFGRSAAIRERTDDPRNDLAQALDQATISLEQGVVDELTH